MPRRNPIDLEIITRKAFELLDSGVSKDDVALQLGVHERTVRRWIVSRGQGTLGGSKTEVVDKSVWGLMRGVEGSHEGGATTIQEERDWYPEHRQAMSRCIPKAMARLEQIIDSVDIRNSDQLRAIEIVGKWGGIADGIDGAIEILQRAGYKVIDPSIQEAVNVESKQLTEKDFYAIQQGILGGWNRGDRNDEDN